MSGIGLGTVSMIANLARRGSTTMKLTNQQHRYDGLPKEVAFTFTTGKRPAA